ncbi:hypothetical protein [Paraburkholderia tropica]|uniref:hypothetical protein n=1 Tax=Paraburkholderia tropica TaxID=92647 RepID=UPI0038B7D976
MEPFRQHAQVCAQGKPAALAFLHGQDDQEYGDVSVVIKASLRLRTMMAAGAAPQKLSTSSSRDFYWTLAQMVTHHTSNGSALETGDLFEHDLWRHRTRAGLSA